jgi:drug/metabolite transporter (DMT)-like permease
MMAAAGVAWGVYTLRGRGQGDPARVTAGNFALAVMPALAASLVAAPFEPPHGTPAGLLLATASGGLASGLGYAIWYAALPGLPPARAAIVQLSVPLLAAVGGVLVLGERFTLRLALAMPLLLGGIALAALVRSSRS